MYVNYVPVNNKAEYSLFQLIAERDRLNKDLETAHGTIKSLEGDLDNLQISFGRGSNRGR